jgi:hypothetical protein
MPAAPSMMVAVDGRLIPRFSVCVMGADSSLKFFNVKSGVYRTK